MTTGLRTRWERLRDGMPGRRFQDRYRESREGDRRGWLGRVVRLVIAGLAIAIGLVLVFIPGPAILFFAIAGTLLATESRGVARFLDWSEVKLRELGSWAMRLWRAWPGWARVAVVIAAGAVAVAAGYAAYRLMFA